MKSLLWARRVVYLCALLGALLGQLFDIGWIFHYIFILTLSLPLLSLLLSLPGILGLQIQLHTKCPAVQRNWDTDWRLVLDNRFGLPAACVTARVRTYCAFTGEKKTFPVTMRGAAPGVSTPVEVDTRHCGLIECTVDHVQVWDCLGLFALPVKAPAASSLLVVPVPEAPGRMVLPEGSGIFIPPPKGKASMGEDYELRPYRIGDSMRSIHWKMSAKRDELVTRELLIEKLPTPVLTFDHFGAPDDLDRILDRLAGYSQALLERECSHEVRWVHPTAGTVRRYAVSCEREWNLCLTAILSDPVPEDGMGIGTVRNSGQDELLYQIHVIGDTPCPKP